MTTRLTFNQPIVYIAIFMIAMAMRLLFVFQWDQTAYGGEPLLDAMVFDNWAIEIAHGKLLRDVAFYTSPLYPYLLGLLYATFGHDLIIAGIFNALLSSAFAVVVGIVTFEAFGIGAALAAGLLAAFDMPLIFYTAPVMKESLALLLLALCLLYVLRALRHNRFRDYALAGGFLGLCALTRGNALLLAPGFLFFTWLKWRQASFRNLGAFVFFTCLSIAPATLHNYLVSHDFVLINYTYGFDLYIGNSPTANGTNNYPPEVSSDPLQEERATTWRAEKDLGHEPKPSEVSSYWRDRALDYIWHNPGREPELLSNKFRAFWNNAEAFDNYDIGFIREHFDTVLSWPLVEFWVIVTLAAVGAVAAWHEARETTTLLCGASAIYMISVLMFYMTDRYRLPILVFILPLAGAAIPLAYRMIREARWKPLIGGVCVGCGALAFTFLPFPNLLDLTAFDWGTLSVVYADEAEDQKALDAFRKGVAIDPRAVGRQAYIAAAAIDDRQGRPDFAEKVFADAIKTYPDNGQLYYGYGRFKAAHGDIRGALAQLQKAQELDPSFVVIYYGLAEIYERLGRHREALEAAWHGLAVDPHDEKLIALLPQLQSKPSP